MVNTLNEDTTTAPAPDPVADWTGKLGLADLEKQHGLPSGLLTSVMRQESAGNPNARSKAGASGLFQFMPATAKQYGIDPTDPQQSAKAAAKMYGQLYKKYQGDLPSTLAGYNWGQGNVDRKGLENAPQETRDYIARINKDMQGNAAYVSNKQNPSSGWFNPLSILVGDANASEDNTNFDLGADLYGNKNQKSASSNFDLGSDLYGNQENQNNKSWWDKTKDSLAIGTIKPEDMGAMGNPEFAKKYVQQNPSDATPYSFAKDIGEGVISGGENALALLGNLAGYKQATPEQNALSDKMQNNPADINRGDVEKTYLEGYQNSPGGQAMGAAQVIPGVAAAGAAFKDVVNPLINAVTGTFGGTPEDTETAESFLPALGRNAGKSSLREIFPKDEMNGNKIRSYPEVQKANMDLADNTTKSYKTAENIGASLNNKSSQNAATYLRKYTEDAANDGDALELDLHTQTNAALNNFSKKAAKKGLNLTTIENTRKQLNRIIQKSTNGNDSFAAKQAVKGIDSIYDAMESNPETLVNGSPEAIQALKAARYAHSIEMRHGQIEQILREAKGNINEIQSEIEKIYDDTDEFSQFHPDDQKLIEDIANPSKLVNSLQTIGKAGPGGNKTANLAEMVGLISMNPVAQGLAGVSALGGWGANVIRGKIIKGSVNTLLRNIENRSIPATSLPQPFKSEFSHVGQKALPAPPIRVDSMGNASLSPTPRNPATPRDTAFIRSLDEKQPIAAIQDSRVPNAVMGDLRPLANAPVNKGELLYKAPKELTPEQVEQKIQQSSINKLAKQKTESLKEKSEPKYSEYQQILDAKKAVANWDKGLEKSGLTYKEYTAKNGVRPEEPPTIPDTSKELRAMKKLNTAQDAWDNTYKQLNKSGYSYKEIINKIGERPDILRYKSGGVVAPSSAQIKVGNYKKEHLSWNGLNIAIENKKGSLREGIDKNGKKWRVKMPNDYGYIKRTEGGDGEHVDIYMGPRLNSERVWIINQRHLHNGKFDEVKVMAGYPSKGHALNAYRKGFSDGKGDDRIKSIHECSVPELKQWLQTVKKAS